MTHEIRHTAENASSEPNRDNLDAPSVNYRKGDKDSPYRILFFPGSCTNIEETADHFQKLYGNYGSLYMVDYQKKGFDYEALKPAIVEELDLHEGVDGRKQTVILSQSLGGPISNVLRLDSAYRERVGDIEIDLADSPPMHPGDLRLPPRVASIVAARLPGADFMNLINRRVMEYAVRNGLPHSDLVDREDANNHGLSTAKTPFSARKGQTRFINKDMRRLLRPGALHGASYASKETYVLSSEYDSVLNPDKAAERLEQLWGRYVLRLVESERTRVDPGNHGGIFEFPRAVMGVLEKRYSDAYHDRVGEVRIPSIVEEAEAIVQDASLSCETA